MKSSTRREALMVFGTAAIATPILITTHVAAQTPPTPTEGDASEYVMQTLMVGTVALRTSEIAAEKATDAMAKEFAGLEIGEQTAVASVLAATEAGKVPPELPAEEQAKIDELQATEAGPEFDVAYVDGQIEGHNRLLEIQKMLSGETVATLEAVTAKLAEQAVTSHLAMLNHIKEQLGTS
jgi:predicted outer membrane protein